MSEQSRSPRVLALAVLLSASCVLGEQPAPGGAVASRGRAILEGVDESGHPEVVLLLLDATGGAAGGICTATVVGSKTLLTAAHCLAKTTVDKTFAEIGKGKIFDVASLHGHPGWDKAVSAYANDIGIVKLVDPAPVAGIPLSFAAPTLDMAVQLVGYGRSVVDDPATAGAKRSGNQQVAGVASGHFTISGSKHNFGPGDSGGPVLATVDGTQVVVGVHSATDTGYTTSYNVRLDALHGWIESTAGGDLLVHGAPPPDPDLGPPDATAAEDAAAPPPPADGAAPPADAPAPDGSAPADDGGVGGEPPAAAGDGAAAALDGGCLVGASSIGADRGDMAWLALILLLLGGLGRRRRRRSAALLRDRED